MCRAGILLPIFTTTGEYRETDIDPEMCEAVVEAKENTDIVTFKKIPEGADGGLRDAQGRL